MPKGLQFIIQKNFQIRRHKYLLNYNEIPVELQLSSTTGQMTSSHECYYCAPHGSSGNLSFDSMKTRSIKEIKHRRGKSSKKYKCVEKYLPLLQINFNLSIFLTEMGRNAFSPE